MPRQETEAFSVQHSVDNGIERVVYIPKHRRFETPILMQHGMYHGAWCWQFWQECLAELGWESHAFSLPGHAGSPVQRPVYFCTLDYYLKFLAAEIRRMPRPPVLMGHSMGGGLSQWYLKYMSDDLPAAILVAAWDARGNLADHGGAGFRRLDPIGLLLSMLTGSAYPLIRTPKHAAQLFLSSRSVYSPEELHTRLGTESLWVMMQHNPPLWHPPERVKTPILCLAGEIDVTLKVEAVRQTALHYKADLIVVPGAAHDLMLEYNYRETTIQIHDWLEERKLK